VTDTGGLPITGLTATQYAGPGAALVSRPLGPQPVAPQSVLAAGATTFVWSVTAQGAGVVAFTFTANGTVICGGSTLVSVALTRTITVQAAVVLNASVAVYPASVCPAQNFLVTLTITNTGGAGANGLALPALPFLLAGPGTASFAAGPTPPLPPSLAGGAAVTLTWTYTGVSAGVVTLTTTVTATDANSGAAATTGPVTTTETVTLPGALLGSATAPLFADQGQWFSVFLTVTNTGGTSVTGITASAFVGAWGSLVSPQG